MSIDFKRKFIVAAGVLVAAQRLRNPDFRKTPLNADAVKSKILKRLWRTRYILVSAVHIIGDLLVHTVPRERFRVTLSTAGRVVGACLSTFFFAELIKGFLRCAVLVIEIAAFCFPPLDLINLQISEAIKSVYKLRVPCVLKELHQKLSEDDVAPNIRSGHHLVVEDVPFEVRTCAARASVIFHLSC